MHGSTSLCAPQDPIDASLAGAMAVNGGMCYWYVFTQFRAFRVRHFADGASLLT